MPGPRVGLAAMVGSWVGPGFCGYLVAGQALPAVGCLDELVAVVGFEVVVVGAGPVEVGEAGVVGVGEQVEVVVFEAVAAVAAGDEAGLVAFGEGDAQG